MQKPDPRDIDRDKWQPCCSDGFRFEPSPYNYVWPMETVEKMYFFISGISMLLRSAEKQFKIVEPSVCENTVASSGIPISQLMTFEDVEPGKMVNKESWMQASGQTSDSSRVNVFYLDLYPMKEGQHTFCKTDKEFQDQFCYCMSSGKNENRLAVQFSSTADLGIFTWSKLFTVIR